jgi:hypothetical protein
MPSLPLSSFHSLWVVKGAGSPIQDETTSDRDLTLLGSGTKPRSMSAQRRRGAEFRTASFSAANGRAFSTTALTLHTALYVSDKIQDFTWFGWVRPQKTGLSAVSLTPYGGLFSDTNMGATPWAFNQPCFLFLPAAAGASHVVVSVMGAILDTRIATQSSGDTTTTPIPDNQWSFVAVRVDGSSSVNNQVDAVTLYTETQSGVRRVYTLGNHRAAAAIGFSLSTAPADNDTVTIDGPIGPSRAYTFKTALAGTPATGQIQNGGAAQPANGDTITIGGVTYTWKTSVTAAQAAAAVIETNSAISTTTGTKQITVNVGGYVMKIYFATRNVTGQPAGAIQNPGTSTDLLASNLFDTMIGAKDNSSYFQIPAIPTTGANANQPWTGRNFTTGTASALVSAYVALSREVPLRAVVAGTAGNATTIEVTDPNTTWVVRLKGATGLAVALAGAGAGSVTNGSHVYTVRFYDASGRESAPSATASVTVVNNAADGKVSVSGIPVGPAGHTVGRKIYRTTAGSTTAFKLLTTIADNTTTTYTDNTADGSLGATMATQSYFFGGTDTPPANAVLIGANWAASKDNLLKAINASGTPGTHYSADITTANATVSASDPGGTSLNLTSRKAGTAGNGTTLTQSGATFTLIAFAGGVDGATADHVLIGANATAAWQNLTDAINLVGTQGLQYGDPTTLNADVTAAIDTTNGILTLTSKSVGTAGNAVTVAASVTAGANVTIKDEFRDKTVATLVGGSNAPPFTAAAGARPDQGDLMAFLGGWAEVPAATSQIFYGAVGDAGIANRVLTDDECAILAATPPPTSTRDRGWYRAAHRMRLAVKSERQSSWPVPRPMGAALAQRIPCGVGGTRAAVRVYGVEAGRPWALTRMALRVDLLGGMRQSNARIWDFPGFVGGVNKSAAPADLDPKTLYDLLNVSFQGGRARRRRGYKIMGGYPGAYYDATNAAGNTYHLVALAGSIYQFDNGELLSVDSGYDQNSIPTVATVGQKTYIVDASRKRVFLEGTVIETGVTAPTQKPLFVTATPATTGAPIATAPGYEYVYTYFDGTKVTESGPSPSTLVVLPPGSNPSTITLSIALSASSSVTKRKVYRRKWGTTTYFLVATVNDNTTTSVTDSAEIPGSEVLETYNEVAVTAEFPSITACAEHEGRLIGWGDTTDLRKIYISEVGDGERWYEWNVLSGKSAVRSVLSHEGRLVVFTDSTVEVVEGDWIRGSDGNLGISKRILDTSKGSFGPFAACSARGRVFWADANGIHTTGVGYVAKDTTQTVSWPVHPLVQDAIDTSGSTVVMAFNHISQELWCCLTKSNPTSATVTKNRVVLVLNLESGVWSIYDHSLAWVTKVIDGLLGYQFIGVDYYGNILELDVYDGDGVQGDEAWIPVSRVTTGVSVANKTVTISGASWSTTAIRGVSVVIEDVSAGTFHRQTALSASGDTITLDDVPSAIVTGDKIYVGGIIGFLETGEVDAGSQDQKKFQEVEVGLVDAAIGRF